MARSHRSLVDSIDAYASCFSADQLRDLLAGVSQLLDVTRELAAEVDLAKILGTITREACAALRCEQANLYRYDADRNELYTSVATDSEVQGVHRSLDEGVVGHVARHRELVHVPDPAQDPRCTAATDYQTGFCPNNILAAPLTVPQDGTLVGVLELLNHTDGPFSELDQHLLRAYCQHAAVALDRVRLVEQLGHQRSTEASLEVARGIQKGFMPDQVPRIPGYEAATWWLANEAVGGDYCDVIRLKNGRIGLTIADVSGHGLGPSLIMATVRAALHALVLDHSEPEVLLNLLGKAMSQDLQDDRFITMLLAVLDPADHSVQYANAGHAPALHYMAATDEFVPLESTGMPLGVIERLAYHQGWPILLEPGDFLILATDGIVEALDDAGNRFGVVRLEEIFRRHAALSIPAIVERVGHAVQAHYSDVSPPDDLTILAVRRNR